MRTFVTLLLLTVLTGGCATGPSFTGAQPDADKTTTSANVTAAAHRTGRVIKCAAIGAVAALVVIPVAIALTSPGTVAASGNPGAWTALALLGLGMGVAMALKDDNKEPCG